MHYISIDVGVTILLLYITVCVHSMYVVCVSSVTMECMCSLSFFVPFEIWFSGGVHFFLFYFFRLNNLPSTKIMSGSYRERHYLTTPGLATKVLETTTTSYTPVISNYSTKRAHGQYRANNQPIDVPVARTTPPFFACVGGN